MPMYMSAIATTMLIDGSEGIMHLSDLKTFFAHTYRNLESERTIMFTSAMTRLPRPSIVNCPYLPT